MHIAGHEAALKGTFSLENIKVLQEISDRLVSAFQHGDKILLCGNGGSAADAQHIAAEFIGRFKRERKSLPAIALTTDTSILTALGNDYSYEAIFARQVEGLGVRGDVLIALSTSGNSKNVLGAAKKAKELGLIVIGFTGKNGGNLKQLCDLTFFANSDQTPHIQEMHITALHAVSEAVEDVLFPS
ncbi:MAG: D-sedoheptulose 7-phosphate isomerase [Candidatus Omnitrophica bacterium]|nr:D-sedoheptulose 7-phosphate isomerase [Candidatus Omnitrophota bacterium]